MRADTDGRSQTITMAPSAANFSAVDKPMPWAAPVMMDAWERAGDALTSELELQMLTRSIELGPDPETFTIRDGALRYAPFDITREADGRVFADDGSILSGEMMAERTLGEDDLREPIGLLGLRAAETIAETASIADSIRRMKAAKIGSLAVVDHDGKLHVLHGARRQARRSALRRSGRASIS